MQPLFQHFERMRKLSPMVKDLLHLEYCTLLIAAILVSAALSKFNPRPAAHLSRNLLPATALPISAQPLFPQSESQP